MYTVFLIICTCFELCRMRENSLCLLESHQCLLFIYLECTGGTVTTTFFTHQSCFPQRKYYHFGMPYLSSWSMVLIYIGTLFHIINISYFVFIQIIQYIVSDMGMVSDTMVRQAAMVVKCILLIYYKNGRGHNYRKQVSHLLLHFNILRIFIFSFILSVLST